MSMQYLRNTYSKKISFSQIQTQPSSLFTQAPLDPLDAQGKHRLCWTQELLLVGSWT